MPDPALLFGFAERINVDQRRPDGFARQIGIERAFAPQSARIGGVAPEIGDRVAHDFAGFGDLAVIVENLARALAVSFEVRAADNQLVGRGILFLDPVERLLSLDIFKPEIGIFGVLRGGRNGSK